MNVSIHRCSLLYAHSTSYGKDGTGLENQLDIWTLLKIKHMRETVAVVVTLVAVLVDVVAEKLV